MGAPCGCGGGGRWLTSLQRGPAPMIATGDVVSPLALVQREGKGGEGGGGRGREGQGGGGRGGKGIKSLLEGEVQSVLTCWRRAGSFWW